MNDGPRQAALSAADGRPWLDETADGEGFRTFHATRDAGFADIFGAIRARVEAGGVRCRVMTGDAQANVTGNVHGGFIMAYVDQVMFCALLMQGRVTLGGAVTLDAGVRFIAGAIAGRPLDAVVEVVGETGRMIFLRGTIEQDGQVTGSFDGTLRKVGKRPA